MSKDDRLKLDGEGFSREPLSEQELAENRAMRHHYVRHFLDADKFIEETGLGWIVAFSRAAPSLVKIISGAAVVGGLLAWLSQRGVF